MANDRIEKLLIEIRDELRLMRGMMVNSRETAGQSSAQAQKMMDSVLRMVPGLAQEGEDVG
jgi:hypothetical protein